MQPGGMGGGSFHGGPAGRIASPPSAPPAASALPLSSGPQVLLGRWGRQGWHHEGDEERLPLSDVGLPVSTHIYMYVKSVSLESLGQRGESENTVLVATDTHTVTYAHSFNSDGRGWQARRY